MFCTLYTRFLRLRADIPALARILHRVAIEVRARRRVLLREESPEPLQDRRGGPFRDSADELGSA